MSEIEHREEVELQIKEYLLVLSHISFVRKLLNHSPSFKNYQITKIINFFFNLHTLSYISQKYLKMLHVSNQIRKIPRRTTQNNFR